MKYNIEKILNKEQSIKLTTLPDIRVLMGALEDRGVRIRNHPIRWAVRGDSVIIARPPELGLKVVWLDQYSDRFLAALGDKIDEVNTQLIPERTGHESLIEKMVRNIQTQQQEKEKSQKEFDDAIRTQLGYPDNETLPEDPLFKKLHMQLGSPFESQIKLDLNMVPTKKKAMILLAIYSILTK
jgi:hypothetical protein